MTRTVPYINEIVSFAVLLLMLVALIAGQADATVQRAARDAAAWAEADQPQDANERLQLSMSSPALTISIAVDAERGGAEMHD